MILLMTGPGSNGRHGGFPAQELPSPAPREAVHVRRPGRLRKPPPSVKSDLACV